MKKIVTIFLSMMFGVSLFAAPVSQEAAQKVALSYYKHYNAKTSDYAISSVFVNNYDGLTTFYVFKFQSGGFVIISADDAVIPVLGYSECGYFDENNMPPNESAWLENYSKEIEYIVINNIDNKETVKQWNDTRNGIFNNLKLSVNPLCATTWDQDSPYNQSCPSNTYAGCVATAMAQVMKKWNYPATGSGSHSYTTATNGYTCSANFGATNYDWTNMLNSYSGGSTSAQKAAVATLIYHCGVSVNMDYDASGSGAYTWDVQTSLINFFNYSPSAEVQFKDYFTSTNWSNMLKAELDEGRPVLYSGDDGSAGHAFVCDGYNISGLFHFNWGWSGSANGYFSIGSLNPIGYSFNQNNMAVVRIIPPLGQPVADFTADNTIPPVGSNVNFTDLSANNPTSWYWTFEGGSPSTSTAQNPTNITYSTAGLYQVTLTVSNASGSDTKIKVQYINVGGVPSAWIKQNTGLSNSSGGISSISIVNPYVVWASEIDETGSTTSFLQGFTRTENGGVTWTSGTITFTGSTSFGIANLCALSDLVCYAAMYPGSAANGGYVAKTVDGGATWSIANSPNYSSSWLNLVHFFDANNGVAMGDPSGTDYIIFTTSNGGTSWTQVSTTSLPNCTSGETGITTMYDTYQNNIWFGTSKGRVYHSTDKGLTWTVATTGLGSSAVVMPVFKDALYGIAVGTSNSTGAYIGMKKTTDGGATWTTITPTGYYVKNPNIDFVPGTTSMWVDGAAYPGSGSSYSINDCASFLDIDTASTVQYTCVQFLDANTGWAGTLNESSTVGGIYKWNPSILVGTNDILQKWDNISIFPNPASTELHVIISEIVSGSYEITLYNLQGQPLYTVNANDSETIFDISQLPAGIYCIKILGNGICTTERVVKCLNH